MSAASASASPSPPRVCVCLLAAGYGTRLERAVRADSSGRFATLIGVPKPLVPIAGQPLITRWMRLLGAAGVPATDTFVVGNAYNAGMLADWARTVQLPPDNIVNDGSTANDNRMGAVADIALLLRHIAAQGAQPDGLLIVGGDTLFYPDFSLPAVLSAFRAAPSVTRILHYSVEDTSKNGILETDLSGLVTSFLEKPAPSETASRKACPCFYLLSKEALKTVQPYVSGAKSLAEVDAPGNLIRHIIALNTAAGSASHLPIQATEIKGRFDIGGLDTYVECDEWFRKHENKQ